MAAKKNQKAAGPAAPSGAAGSEAQAAQRESQNGGGPVIEFLGIEITLPPKLRESVIWRAGILREDDFQGTARLVQSVIGAEQFARILDRLDEQEVYVIEPTEDDEEPVSPMGELLDKALSVYGLSLGESQASTDS